MNRVRITNLMPHLTFLYGFNQDIRLEPRAFANSTFEIEIEEEKIEPSILRASSNGMIRLEITDISPVYPPVEDPEIMPGGKFIEELIEDPEDPIE